MFCCDNLSMVHIINFQTSRSLILMWLVHLFVLQRLQFNIKLVAKHISGVSNALVYALSHFQFPRFRELAPGAAFCPSASEALETGNKKSCTGVFGSFHQDSLYQEYASRSLILLGTWQEYGMTFSNWCSYLFLCAPSSNWFVSHHCLQRLGCFCLFPVRWLVPIVLLWL